MKRLPTIALLACALSTSPLWAQTRECGPQLYKKISDGLKIPGFQDLAADWVTKYQKANDLVAKGMTKAVLQKDVKTMIEGFRDLPPGVNPFANEDEVYEAIGKLTDDAYEGVPGLNDIVGNLFANTASNEKGALFSLKIADEAGLSAKVLPGNGAGFEQTVAASGVERRYDMREPAAGAGPIGGIVHENKNWVTLLSGPNDSKLVDFADEFRRDILIHSQTNWAFYRINMRATVQGQSSMIRDRLLMEFQSESVQNTLGPVAADNLKRAFEDLWNIGDGGALLRFY